MRGHAAKVCSSGNAEVKSVTVADPPDNGSENAEQIDESVYNVNLFRIRDAEVKPKVS